MPGSIRPLLVLAVTVGLMLGVCAGQPRLRAGLAALAAATEEEETPSRNETEQDEISITLSSGKVRQRTIPAADQPIATRRHDRCANLGLIPAEPTTVAHSRKNGIGAPLRC